MHQVTASFRPASSEFHPVRRAGTAEESIQAARNGHRVTILDSSRKMLAIAEQRIIEEKNLPQIRLLHADFFAMDAQETFDAIALHFFLDVFDLTTVNTILQHCKLLLSPDGILFVADFSNPNGPFVIRLLQSAYQQGGAMACWILARQPWLQIGDYQSAVQQCGFRILNTRHIGMRWLGKSWFKYFSATPSAGAR